MRDELQTVVNMSQQEYQARNDYSCDCEEIAGDIVIPRAFETQKNYLTDKHS